jgi:heat shock protein HslJ
MRIPSLILLFALSACVQVKDDPYVWQLVSIDGQPFGARATLVIDGDRATGQAPCNQWSGRIIREPFPQWRIRDVVATEMACDDLAAETAFFAAMADMTHSSVGFGHLELVDQNGRVMAFSPATP